MNWISLNNSDQLQAIVKESSENPVLIFKHSTSCGISRVTMDRMERNWKETNSGMKLYYLDLRAHRDISNAIATGFQVQHESPQVLIIRNGEAVFHASHYEINAEEIQNFSAKS